HPLARALRGESTVEQELTVVYRGEQRGMISTSAAPVHDPEGKLVAAVVAFSDITERRAAEAQRRELLRQAEIARSDAEAANRAKDAFLAMLGHELRNPLAPITTALHLMRLRGSHETERERTIIERQTDHLVRLVDDLLDVSRITRGKIELKTRPIELAEV